MGVGFVSTSSYSFVELRNSSCAWQFGRLMSRCRAGHGGDGAVGVVWRQGDGEELGHGADLAQLRHATGVTDVRLNDADCVLLQHVAEFLTGVELLAGGYGHSRLSRARHQAEMELADDDRSVSAGSVWHRLASDGPDETEQFAAHGCGHFAAGFASGRIRSPGRRGIIDGATTVHSCPI